VWELEQVSAIAIDLVSSKKMELSGLRSSGTKGGNMWKIFSATLKERETNDARRTNRDCNELKKEVDSLRGVKELRMLVA
jgi:hypothetical protein